MSRTAVIGGELHRLEDRPHAITPALWRRRSWSHGKAAEQPTDEQGRGEHSGQGGRRHAQHQQQRQGVSASARLRAADDSPYISANCSRTDRQPGYSDAPTPRCQARVSTDEATMKPI